MRIADYEPREDLVYYLHELYFEFGQPSADNLADWEIIVIRLTIKFPIRVSLTELTDFFEENQVFNDDLFYFQVITSVQNILLDTSYA
jgi:hypothetical protein